MVGVPFQARRFFLAYVLPDLVEKAASVDRSDQGLYQENCPLNGRCHSRGWKAFSVEMSLRVSRTRDEAISAREKRDCHVAPLLAMTCLEGLSSLDYFCSVQRLT